MKQIAPFGSWSSPVTPEFVAGKSRNLTSNIQVDKDKIYFLESRPDEGGRMVLVEIKDHGHIEEILPKEFNVRTRYLEYGGRSFLIEDGRIYFVNFKDQHIYTCELGQTPVPLTQLENNRFCDFVLDKKNNRLVALREQCQKPESVNSICAIDLKTGEVKDLLSGNDFYNCARINSDGDRILWITWNHPNMPWNGTELWLGELDEQGEIVNKSKIVGDKDHGVCQARWSHDDKILFVAELDSWYNLYKYSEGEVKNLYPLKAEFAGPDWVPGIQNYAECRQGEMCCSYIEGGQMKLAKITDDEIFRLARSFAFVPALYAYRNGFVAVVCESDAPNAIIYIDKNNEITELYKDQELSISKSEISLPEEIQFLTEDGGVGFAWYYPPTNKNFEAQLSEKPPLIVKCHGGPTSMSPAIFSKMTQFWTSRGYALVDVNYGGSTGYGRDYRERLRDRWGEVDVNDCVAVVNQLVKEDRVDKNRVAIRGGSAGGFTTLAALTFTEGVFSVGSSYYGVSELEILAKETHKLESRYLDQLVGPYPEAMDVYKERSPIEHVDQLNCPISFFQGDEDMVVPPNQSEMMYKSLLKKSIPTEYHLYMGEGHGFRKAETIQHSLKAEHTFYAKVFGFEVQPEDSL